MASPEQDRFERDVVTLAADGTPLTVANVTARTRLPPRKVESMLDQMVSAGLLDSDVDERDAVVVYRVRGLSAKARPRSEQAVRDRLAELARDAGLSPVRSAAARVVVKQATAQAVSAVRDAHRSGEKSVVVGGLLGLFLGPLGLAYAAPWLVVLISTVAYVVAASVPIVRSIFGFFALFIHLGFAIAGALYALRYNKAGRRSPLLPPEEPHALP